MPGFANAIEHLLAELARVDLILQREILLLRAANAVSQDEFLGLYISGERADALLSAVPDGGENAQQTRVAMETLDGRITALCEQNRQRVLAAANAGVELPLPRLARIFHLTPFELDVLLIAAAPEIDLRYETLFAYVQNDVTKKHPTVDLVLKLLCATLEERAATLPLFHPANRLFQPQLLHLCAEDAQSAQPAEFVKMDRRVAGFLLGDGTLDPRLTPATRRLTATPSLDALPLADTLKKRLAKSAPFLAQGVVALFDGPNESDKLPAAAALGALIGRALLRCDVRQALAAETPFAAALPLLWREALLQGAGIYFDHFEALLDGDERAAAARLALVGRLGGPGIPVFLASSTPWHPRELNLDAECLRFDFPLPDFAQRLRLWQVAVGHLPLASAVDLAPLADKFSLSTGQIERAAREAALLAVQRGGSFCVSGDDLHRAARAQSSQGLSRLAQKVEPLYSWDDLILPARTLQQLRAIGASVTYRHVVYAEWGFDRKLAAGTGLNVLFSGPSGTGKTMAAQIIARELALDLYKIDLASVVSKYIGETEKNLSQIFREAQTSNAILFFDEADALFGKRSEIKDSHDRYANVEIAYLLQKMEEYEGIVILATNLGKNMDEAFARRMHHTVEFPFPDAECRERIWRRIFPEQVALAGDVNIRFLARQFELAGGNIRNVALAAAFTAAAGGGALTMAHLVWAVAREYQKLGKLPAQADFRQFYELIREQG